jgi:hypothetical protein
MASRESGTTRAWLLTMVGLALAAGCGTVEPSMRPAVHSADPVRSCVSATPHAARTAAKAHEPATPRGLACALLRHLPSAAGAQLSGIRSSTSVNAAADLDGPVSSYDVTAYGPDEPSYLPTAPGCHHLDSGYRPVVCRTDRDGTLVAILRGGPHALRERMPMLIGRAFRPDGTSLLLMMYVGSGQLRFPQAEALRILTDPAVGWYVTPEANEAGRRLPHFTRSHIEVEMVEDEPSDPPAVVTPAGGPVTLPMEHASRGHR